MLRTLGDHGLQAVMTMGRAADAEVFCTYVKRVLGPTLHPGDIVVMDDLRAHQAVGVQQALADVPALSPMEPCWSTGKTALRTANAGTRDGLDTAITHALTTVARTNTHS
jgi:hypothetical protein